jgi:hypothetical protein
VEHAGGSREKFEALITTIARTLRDLPDHPRIVLRELASAGGNLQPEVIERLVRLLGTVRGLLSDGVQSGEFRATDPVNTHLAVVGATLMLTTAPTLLDRVSEVDPGIQIPVGDAGAFLADLLINGISTS